MAGTSSKQICKAFIDVMTVLWDKTDSCHQLTMDELMAELERLDAKPERRLIYSAIDAADESDLGAKRPRGQGRSTEGYRLDNRPFARWEVSFLMDAVQASRALDTKQKASLRGRLVKLLPECDRLESLRDIAVSAQDNSYSDKVDKALSALQKAITKKERVTFTYWEYDIAGQPTVRDSSTGRETEPYTFIFANDTYYLIGGIDADNGIEVRTWRVDRITDVTPTGNLCISSLSSLGIDLQRALAGAFGMFLTEEPLEVTLQVQPDMVKYIVEKFGTSAIITPEGDIATVRVCVVPSQAFFGWVFSFAGKVKLLGPDTVVERYNHLLQDAADQ